MTFPMMFRRFRLRTGLLGVQSGQKTLASADTSTTVTITAVLKEKSILFFNYSSASAALSANINEVRGVLTNTTTITFDRGANGADITINWWVIEFEPGTPITIQHLAAQATSSTENVSISAVDLAHTFPICTCITSASVGTGKATVKADFTSTVNCQLSFESINNTFYGLQVITHQDWDVDVYTDSAASGDTTEDTPLSPSITLAETMLFGYAIFSVTGNPTADEWFNFGFTAVNNIQAVRTTSGKAANFTYYAVKTNGKIACQHDVSETIAGGNSVGNTAFAAVTIANTPVIVNNMANSVGNNSTNNTTTGEAVRLRSIMNSTTNCRTERAAADASTNIHSLSLYDFTNA